MRLTTKEHILLRRRTSGDWLAIPGEGRFSHEVEKLITRGLMERRLDPVSGRPMWRATAKGRRALLIRASP